MNKQDRLLPTSELFLIRLWQEDVGDGQQEWRGRVQHALSGEVHFFREWHVLIQVLQKMLKDKKV